MTRTSKGSCVCVCDFGNEEDATYSFRGWARSVISQFDFEYSSRNRSVYFVDL